MFFFPQHFRIMLPKRDTHNITNIKKALFSNLEDDINALMRTPKIIKGEEMEIYAPDLFGEDEVEMNFTYGDGLALSEDNKYIMLYPKKKALTPIFREAIRAYDGIPSPREYTCRDIALCFGEVFENPFVNK